MFGTRIYLDWAAAAPVSKAAQRAFDKAVRTFGNPSSQHEEGRAARLMLEDARTKVARILEVKADSVVFTGSATEANALAVLGALGSDGHALYLPSAHSSVFENLKGRADALRVADGVLDIEDLKRKLRKETRLISIERVNSETGMLISARAVRQALIEVGRKDILIHVDASQSPLVESVELARMDADLMTLDTGKIGGIRGIGVLIAPRSAELVPLYTGGGQERGLRSGTESHALAAAFAAALEECRSAHKVFSVQALLYRVRLLQRIGAIPGVDVNEGKENAPHILNVSFPGIDTDYLVALLDSEGIAVSTKSACESDEKGSRTVLAMYGDTARAESTLRISWGPSTRDRELASFIQRLEAMLAFLETSRSK